MQSALKLNTVVLPGRRIELATPELTEGMSVEVLILIAPTAETPLTTRLSALEIIENLRGQKSFSTAQEVAASLEEDRASWDHPSL